VRIVARGLTVRCPNCGGRTLFDGPFSFHLNPVCRRCGLKLDRGDGFFMGSMSLNYGMTLTLFLLPVALLAYHGVIGSTLAIVLAGFGAIGVPILLYRPSRSWWLMNYFVFFPQHLPANGGNPGTGQDDNV
jgi:hypothetical protein